MEIKTEEGADSAGYLNKHSTGATEATAESDARQCHEKGKEVAASVGDPASAGPATAEDGHEATGHWRLQREEGGDKNLRK